MVIAGGPMLKFLSGVIINTGKTGEALGKLGRKITGLDKPVEEIGGKLVTAATGAGKMTLGMTRFGCSFSHRRGRCRYRGNIWH